MDKEHVIEQTSRLTKWWINERLEKLKANSHDTMSINPFMAPLIMGLQGYASFEELSEFLLGGHFLTGHSTGFGKLVDEKILPVVFHTQKLDAAFRRTKPYNRSEFDNIDHIVIKKDDVILLSQKASRWTIQLSQAVELNKSFVKLLQLRKDGDVSFSKIVVGIFYGKADNLTDKYRIAQGITTGKVHDVVDISKDVAVYAGREFWTWIGDGKDNTQEWIMLGVIKGLGELRAELSEAQNLLEKYKQSFISSYSRFISKEDGTVDWIAFLKEING